MLGLYLLFCGISTVSLILSFVLYYRFKIEFFKYLFYVSNITTNWFVVSVFLLDPPKECFLCYRVLRYEENNQKEWFTRPLIAFIEGVEPGHLYDEVI